MNGRQAEIAQHARALMRSLQQDLALGRKLAELAVKLTAALKDREPGRVLQIEAEALALTERQTAAESERNAAAQALAGAVGLAFSTGQGATVTHLASRVPDPDSRRLLDLRAAILQTQYQLQAANARNHALIASATDYTQFSLKLLMDAATRPATYGPAYAAVPTFYIDQKC